MKSFSTKTEPLVPFDSVNLRFWSSLYYWLVLVTLPIYIVDKVLSTRRKSSKKEL